MSLMYAVILTFKTLPIQVDAITFHLFEIYLSVEKLT